jgi:UDP-N-acetylglucosamine 1-carboxyvinyltransferase
MSKLVIKGGTPLKGTVRISGSKNGTLPLMAAAILAHKKVVLRNTPDLTDIRHMGNALKYVGMNAEFAPDTITIQTEDPSKVEIPYEVSQMMRASIAFLGPLLAKRKHAKVALPGGCIIGPRPVDLHLKGLAALGADIKIEHGFIKAEAKKLKGAHIYLGGNYGSSVLATANVMMAASAAEGVTIIEHAACEPEIVELGLFLKELGVVIEGEGSHCLKITGIPEYDEKEIEFTVVPDRIEAGTFLVIGSMPGNELEIENLPRLHLGAAVDKLEQADVTFTWGPGSCKIHAPSSIRCVDITTLPYPGFPTDLQAQMMAVLSTAAENSTITEKVYPDRFMHIGELNRMGAIIRKEGNTAFITGVDELSGTQVRASDLRASAAMVIAGLMADYETEIFDIHHLDRGYDNLEKKLISVGAEIERVEDV